MLNLRTIYSIALLYFTGAVTGEAVQTYTPIVADPILEPWRWRHEEAVDGVGTLCMDKAPDGSLWFGGTQGFAHYDGLNVVRYRLGEDLTAAITSREDVPWVKALLCTKEQGLLALIGESLVLWSEQDWEIVIQDVGQSVFFDSLFRGKDGSYWLQVREGVWQISSDFSAADRVLAASRKYLIMSACIDSHGDVWAIRKVTDDQFRLIQIPVDNGRPREEVQWYSCPIPFQNDSSSARLIAGKDGYIWYVDGSSRSGLEVFSSREKQWLETDMDRGYRGLYSLIGLDDGSIWSGGEGAIVRRTPRGNIAEYTQINLDLPLVPLVLFNFGDNRLWVIGRGGRVYSVDLGYEEWMTYAGLSFQCETHDGIQWYLSELGNQVICYNPHSEEWLQYDAGDGLIGEGFRLIASSHGFVWMTGRHEKQAALAVFDGVHWSRFVHPEFGEWIEPNAVFEASDGSIWLGAGGLRLSKPNTGGALRYGVDEDGQVALIEHYIHPPLPYYGISFSQFPDGPMLIGSTIVHTFIPGENEAPAYLSYPRDNTVDLSFDSKGTFWVAKEHAGLYRQEDGVWSHYSLDEGLASSLLAGLLVLKDDTVLVATDRGVSRFDGKTWLKNAYPEVFGMSKRWSSLRESSDGSIWLNYSRNETKMAQHIISGANVFRTTRHRPEKRPPDTFITDYLKRVAQPGNSHVKWAARDLWGDTPKEYLQFSWKLNDGDWSPFSSARSQTFLDLNHGKHELQVRARDRAFNVDPTPARIEFFVIAPIWLQSWFLLMVAFMLGGTILWVWMLIYSHEKRLKDRARHLVEVDEMKTSFFTNISHELNTPLSLIGEPLKRVLTSDLNEKDRNRIGMALRNANRVSMLVSQIMDLRKLELGRMPMDLVEGDLGAIVRDTVERLQPLAQMHDVQCTFTADDSPRVWHDVDKLTKIVQNLVSNAIKYTDKGGRVEVSLSFGKNVSGEAGATIMVEDTGKGIAAEYLGHVFDRFYRIPEKSMVDGSGIGLNLTKELVDLWGGNVSVDSPIHEHSTCPGTRFTVELPVDKDSITKAEVK